MWLEGEAIPGPPSDHLDNRERYFAIASNMLPSDSPADSTADLISPYIIGTEHPKECFKFWFYFGVSYYNAPDNGAVKESCTFQGNGDHDRMRVLQRIKDVESPIILWDLDKSFVEAEVKWYPGQIEITAEAVEGFEYRVSHYFGWPFDDRA